MKKVHHSDAEVNNDILINVLLDRSGSMAGRESDVIGNFNAFIKSQKELSGVARVSLVLFDTQYEAVYVNKDIQSVPTLNAGTYYVRGSTALLDALGRLIASVDAIESKPQKILFLINTDGFENSSREFTKSKIKELVTERQNNHDWQFLFIGAGIDAFTEHTGAGLGLYSYQTFTGSNTAIGNINSSNYSNSVTRSMRTTDLKGEDLYMAAFNDADLVEDALAPNTAGNSANNAKPFNAGGKKNKKKKIGN